MQELKKEQLENISGGAISAWGVFGIIAAAIFIVGFVDGIARPVKCG